MKIQSYKIPDFLKNQLHTVRGVLIFGEDVGMTREYMHTVLNTLNVADMDCIRLQPEDVETDSMTILNASDSPSLLGGQGLQIVRMDTISNACATAVKTFLDAQNDGFLLVLAQNLAPSNPIRKLFESSKAAAALPCYPDDARSIGTLIRTHMQQNHIHLDKDALSWMQDHMGADRMVTRMELEKLVLYAGDEKRLSLQDVQASMVDSSDHRVDDVVYAVANGNPRTLERTLPMVLDEGINPIQILRICQAHFVKLHRARLDMDTGKSIDDVTRGVFWKHKNDFKSQLQSWKTANLVRCMFVLGEAEKKCKQTASIPELILSRTFYTIIRLRKA